MTPCCAAHHCSNQQNDFRNSKQFTCTRLLSQCEYSNIHESAHAATDPASGHYNRACCEAASLREKMRHLRVAGVCAEAMVNETIHEVPTARAALALEIHHGYTAAEA